MGHCGGDGQERLTFHGLLHDETKVPGGSVVVFVVETVGIGKMGTGAAQSLGFFVHHFHKGIDRTSDIFSGHIAGLIGRGKHDAVQQFLNSQLLTDFQTGGAAGSIQILQSCFRHSNRIGKGAVFQGQ